jgi:cell division protein FtsQ
MPQVATLLVSSVSILARAVSSRRRVLVLALLSGALALTYFGWFRDSSLVAVRDVQVKGVSSTDGEQIVTKLTDAAHGMTTLHVQDDRLLDAVREFPTVASVSTDASFPHGLTIRVVEHPPTAIARAGDRQVPVGADGSLLPGTQVGDERLPELRLDELPASSGRLSGEALSEALAIGAAPAPLRPLISDTSVSGEQGIVVALRGGIELRFGTRLRAHQKWAAVAAILADEGLTSVSYVDVRVPHRPAVSGVSAVTGSSAP